MIESEADRANGVRPTPGPVLAYGAPDARQRAAPLATAAMWLSLSFVPLLVLSVSLRPHPTLALTFLLPVAGLVLGIAGWRDRAADARTRRTARTACMWGGGQLLLIGLAVWLVSGTGRAREPANRIKCASNLRQIGQALQLYSTECGGAYPPSFDEILLTGDIVPEAFVCPSSTGERAEGATHQELLQNFHRAGACSFVYALEGQDVPASSVTPKHVLAYEDMANHNRQGMNVLYGDGSTEWLGPREAARVLAELQGGYNPPRRTR